MTRELCQGRKEKAFAAEGGWYWGSGEGDQPLGPGKEGKGWEGGGVVRPGQKEMGSPLSPLPSLLRSRRRPVNLRRSSVLPLQWRLTHSPRWTRQILVSELSLVAFVLLLVMVFSEKWLHAPGCRFHQYHPANVSHGIHTSIHIMSLGLLHICISESCTESDYGKGEHFANPGPPAHLDLCGCPWLVLSLPLVLV